MEEQSKVIIEKLYFDKLISELKNLSTVCVDPFVKDKLVELEKNLSNINAKQNKVSVENQIEKRMEEVRGKDSDLNAKLYMLLQDLKRGRISEDEALEICERYVKNRNFDRMVY